MSDDKRNEFWLGEEAHVTGDPNMSDEEKDVLLKMVKVAKEKAARETEHECQWEYVGIRQLEIEEFDDVGDVIGSHVERTEVYQCKICNAIHQEW